MVFVRLNHTTLLRLKEKGYNVLTSASLIDSDNPSWIPDKVNLVQFLNEFQYRMIRFEEQNLLLIDDALLYMADDDFSGQVLIF
ncbi:hypothetical protein [Sphingobacterium sp. MYb382]|uniref:hypothetical protein n=1 Tax=Sphingobacterium sp. MYb382 TaxID=2745278 RepID=UPI00309EEEAB